MTDPTTAREALIVEVVGDAARLIREVEALAPMLKETCQALVRANTELRDTLAGFERRMAAISENVKIRSVQHLAMRVDDAAKQSIEQQSRAMADAARVAFGAELGATMISRLRLQERQRHGSWLCASEGDDRSPGPDVGCYAGREGWPTR
jgi:hypothetical protein